MKAAGEEGSWAKKEAACASGSRGGVLELTKPFTVEMMPKKSPGDKHETVAFDVCSARF